MLVDSSAWLALEPHTAADKLAALAIEKQADFLDSAAQTIKNLPGQAMDFAKSLPGRASDAYNSASSYLGNPANSAVRNSLLAAAIGSGVGGLGGAMSGGDEKDPVRSRLRRALQGALLGGGIGGLGMLGMQSIGNMAEGPPPTKSEVSANQQAEATKRMLAKQRGETAPPATKYTPTTMMQELDATSDTRPLSGGEKVTGRGLTAAESLNPMPLVSEHPVGAGIGAAAGAAAPWLRDHRLAPHKLHEMGAKALGETFGDKEIGKFISANPPSNSRLFGQSMGSYAKQLNTANSAAQAAAIAAARRQALRETMAAGLPDSVAAKLQGETARKLALQRMADRAGRIAASKVPPSSFESLLKARTLRSKVPGIGKGRVVSQGIQSLLGAGAGALLGGNAPELLSQAGNHWLPEGANIGTPGQMYVPQSISGP